MAVAYQSGLMGDFFRRSAQQRALTGLPTSYQEQRGLLDPMLAYDAQKTQQAGLLANQQAQFDRQMSLQEKARRDQQVAGMVGGVGQLAMLPLAYGAAKNLGWIGGKTAVTAPAAAPVTDASITAAGGAFNAPNAAAAGYGLQAPGYTAPVLSTAQGSVTPGLLGGTTAQGAAIGAGGGSAAYTGATGTAAYGSAEGAGTASVLGAEGGGLLSTVGTYAPPVAAGLLGGNLGSKLAMKYSPIGGQREKTIGGGILGGAAAGAAAGSFFPGVGTLVGGVVGGILGGLGSLF